MVLNSLLLKMKMKETSEQNFNSIDFAKVEFNILIF